MLFNIYNTAVYIDRKLVKKKKKIQLLNNSILFFTNFLQIYTIINRLTQNKFLADRSVRRPHNRRPLLSLRLLHPLHGHAFGLPLALPHLLLSRELPQPADHGLRQQPHEPLLRARTGRSHLLPLHAAHAVPQRDGNRAVERRPQFDPNRGHRRAYAPAHG